MRLHPAASRIKRLAQETPATLIGFDCLLRKPSQSLELKPFEQRHSALLEFFASIGAVDHLIMTPYTRDRRTAATWLKDRHVFLDGVVAKRLDLPYQPGRRAMVKVKHLRTADCVVGGFRYERNSSLVGSLLLGLYDDNGLLNYVGFTSGLTDSEKPALTKRLKHSSQIRASPAMRQAVRADGARNGRTNGIRWRQSWWSRCDTTTSPISGFAMVPGY